MKKQTLIILLTIVSILIIIAVGWIIIDKKENERIDDLEFKNLKIIQNKNGFCFGIDAVLLTRNSCDPLNRRYLWW